MFKENLDPEIASKILGDDYNANHKYILISDPDSFVIAEADEKGEILGEIKLKEEAYTDSKDDNTEEEEDYAKVTTKHNIPWTLIIMSIVLTLTIATFIYVLLR